MNYLNTTGKVIITVAVTNMLALASPPVLNAKMDCKPNADGMCLLPVTDDLDLDDEDDAVDSEGPVLIEKKKNIVSNTACTVFEPEQPSFMERLAGELYTLRRRLILKAQKAGKLLQVQKIIVQFMRDCGLQQNRHIICNRKQKIPYRDTVFSCSEES